MLTAMMAGVMIEGTMTKEEVVACWEGCEEYISEFDAEVQDREDAFDVTVKAMYEYVPLTLDILLKLAKVFGTDKFRQSQYHSGGCDTCNFGSSYEVTFSFDKKDIGTFTVPKEVVDKA